MRTLLLVGQKLGSILYLISLLKGIDNVYKDERPTRFLENEAFDQWLIAKDTLVDEMRLFIVNILEEAVLHGQLSYLYY